MNNAAMRPRETELTSVVNRELFDQLPAGATSDADKARWAKFRADYHRAQKLAEHPFPLQLDVEVNSTCNLRCAFCTHGRTKVAKRSLTTEQFRRAVDEGSEHGLCSIKLNYINEPLLVKNLTEYIEYARSRGVLNIYFATNGTLLTEAVGRELIAAKLSKIMVSIDAATPETYAKMRGSDKYEMVVANIKNFVWLRNSLSETHPLVRVNFLKTKLNAHESEAFVKLWENEADMIGFQEQVRLPGLDDDLLPSNRSEPVKFRCSFPFKLMVLDSGGNILPCCTFSGRAMLLGHIDSTTLAEAWTGEKMRALKELHKAGRYEENPVCLHCVGPAPGHDVVAMQRAA